MAQRGDKPRPWLIAAWPGMGNVAVIAAGYLIHELGMKEAGELEARGHFDITEVEVKDGVIVPPSLPRGLFYRWRNPRAGRDVIVFLAEDQPSSGTYAYAHGLLEKAADLDVERVVTFASMASGLHPAANPKVTGVATDEGSLAELRRAEVEPLGEGQIGGLNGVLLGVAAERGMPGICLLAEIPYFAARVPNPKAARAALSVFCVLAGIEVSLEELNKHAAAVDKALIDALEKAQRKAAAERDDHAEEESEEPADEPAAAEPEPSPAPEPRIDFATRSRIERMFEEARKDTAKAVPLKDELDRLGIFKQYEDRFLDLFRRAG